jgi:hypothetical protein
MFSYYTAATQELQASNGLLVAYLFGYVSFCLMCIGFSSAYFSGWNATAVYIIVVSSVPLFENHITLFGYAEFWLTIFLAVALMAIVKYREHKEPKDLLISMFALAGVLLSKNTGMAYVMVFCMALISSYLCSATIVYGGALALAGVGFIKVMVDHCLQVTSLGKKLGVCDHGNVISFGGYDLHVLPPALDVFYQSVSQALFINLTFSVAVSFMLVALLQLRELQTERHLGFPFLMNFVYIGILSYFFSFFLDYGQKYSVIGNDTSGSRYLLPYMMAISLLIPIVFKETKRL